MMGKLLWYDLETSGLNPGFSQVMQCAWVETDLELNILQEEEFIVKLTADIIPSPKALTVHHISVNDSNTKGISEFEAINKIHKRFNVPDTTTIGYNTLGFDDEFLRFSFYRYMLEPYSHQYKNGCQRADLYPIVVLFYLFDRDALEWPQRDGQPSFKLDDINQLNGFVDGQAHNAVVDVKATLALAKHLRDKNKRLFDYGMTSFEKNSFERRLAKLPNFKLAKQHREAIYVGSNMGRDNAFSSRVILLGNHRVYKNQQLWLRLDLSELSKTTLDSIAENTWVIRHKPGESGFFLIPEEKYLAPLREERKQVINRLSEFYARTTDDDLKEKTKKTTERLEKTDEIIEYNKKWLLDNPEIFEAICQYYANFTYPAVDNVDTNSGLYLAGFYSFQDKTLVTKFLGADFQDKLNIISEFKSSFLQELGLRLLGRCFPQELKHASSVCYGQYLDYLQQMHSGDPRVDFRGGESLTALAAQTQIDELLNEPISEKQKEILFGLREYLNKKVEFINDEAVLLLETK